MLSEANVSSECKIDIYSPFASFMPLFIALYMPLSSSLITFEIYSLYSLIISKVESVEPPYITIYSIYL